MPTAGDILALADLFKSRSVDVQEERCVAVRNRNASCKRCAETCLAHAINVSTNRININIDACMACGACIAVCPTAAIVGLEPTDEEIIRHIKSATDQADGMSVFACARIASQQMGDPDKFVELPCLGRIDEALLVSLVARGFNNIVLVDGTCFTCKYRDASKCVNNTIQSAADLLKMRGATLDITRVSEFPPNVVFEDERKAAGAARRGAFTQTGGYAKNVALNIADRVISGGLQQNRRNNRSLQQRMGAKNGKLPIFEAQRNMQILNDLFTMGTIAQSEISSRLFGVVSIDASKCSGCGMCVMFCPTGAIKYSVVEEPEDKTKRYLEFQIADCTQCNLCVDVCLRHCLEISPVISVEELFDFEPRLIEVPGSAKKRSLSDRS